MYSSVDSYCDTGTLSVYAGCLPERFAEVVEVATDVLASVAADGITEAECRIAKGRALRGALVLGLEDSASRMNRIGRNELNYGEHRSLESSLAKIEAVTLDEVNAVARTLLTRPFGAAVLGDYPSKKLPKQLTRLLS